MSCISPQQKGAQIRLQYLSVMRIAPLKKSPHDLYLFIRNALGISEQRVYCFVVHFWEFLRVWKKHHVLVCMPGIAFNKWLRRVLSTVGDLTLFYKRLQFECNHSRGVSKWIGLNYMLREWLGNRGPFPCRRLRIRISVFIMIRSCMPLFRLFSLNFKWAIMMSPSLPCHFVLIKSLRYDW